MSQVGSAAPGSPASGHIRELLLLGDHLDPEILGDRIRRLRRGAGFTQADLARGLVTAAYVSRIESGQRVPSAGLLREFVDRLGVSVNHLLAREEPDIPSAVDAVRAADAAAAWLEAPDDLRSYARMLDAVQAWKASRDRHRSPALLAADMDDVVESDGEDIG